MIVNQRQSARIRQLTEFGQSAARVSAGVVLVVLVVLRVEIAVIVVPVLVLVPMIEVVVVVVVLKKIFEK